MTAATELRRAATLMRERAATAEPGRWKTWGMQVMADPLGTSDVDDCILVANPVSPSTSGRLLHTGNTDHIASWHPAVALAVAAWLDAEAEVHIHTTDGRLLCAAELPGMDNTPAMRVARAYLGDDR